MLALLAQLSPEEEVVVVELTLETKWRKKKRRRTMKGVVAFRS